MILIFHKSNKVVQVLKDEKEISFGILSIAEILMMLAKKHPNDWLIWCHIDLKDFLNISSFDTIFHHNKIMASYCMNSNEDFLPEALGYVEESLYLKINKTKTYPTWLMSSNVGGINAEVLLEFDGKIKLNKNFDYFLNSLAKIGIPKGLICYSDPRFLLENTIVIPLQKANNFSLFKFVKQHYRARWVFLLFLNFLIFEKKLPFMALLFSLRFKNRQSNNINLSEIKVQSKLQVVDLKTIDVIIPTIGRKNYLYDVLNDLSKQTHLPENVIIVEQNPIPKSKSELDYLTTEKWPFIIKHIFTQQSGACNARNVALSQVSSEWVFFNDDDNKFDCNLIHDIFSKIEQYGTYIATTSYIQPNEKLIYKITNQSGIFGSGNSFVKSSCLKNVSFSLALEFGYGEDVDYGMQLRNQGFDVIYFPKPRILHLKAPFGGFRIKPELAWQDEKIQPKPSPTIMYVKQKYLTRKQIAGYKFVLFFKMIRKESIFNWFSFYVLFKQRWKVSLEWSKKI
jgi:glycosyltransferase involved in cell wall biosynthesis